MTEFNNGFEAGYISAIRTFGIYKDGEQYIGAMRHNVKDLTDKIQSRQDKWFNQELFLAHKNG